MKPIAIALSLMMLGSTTPAAAAIFQYRVDLGPATGSYNVFQPAPPDGNWNGDFILDHPPALRGTINSISVRMTGRYEYDASFDRAEGECSEDEPWFCGPHGNYHAQSRTTLYFSGAPSGSQTIDRSFAVPTSPLEFSGVDRFDFTVDLAEWGISEETNEVFLGSWELFDETVWDFGQTEVRPSYAYSFDGRAVFRIDYSRVPEPGALGLVALALICVGLGRHRQTAKSQG